DTFTLPQTGTYTLTVEGYIYVSHASGDYALNLLPESYPAISLLIGNTISGTIPVLGQRQYYTFALPSAATLYFDALTNADFSWRLDGRGGQIVGWRPFLGWDGVDVSDPALPLAAGDYSLAVGYNNFAGTGGYQFRFSN